MNKSKLIEFVEEQMVVFNEFIKFFKKNDNDLFYLYWLGKWGVYSDLLQMIDRGDFDDNDSN